MKISQFLKNNYLSYLIVIFVFFLDRFTKTLILDFFNNSINQELNINSFLNFVLVRNEGIAFGLLKFEQNIYYNLITLIIIIILFLLIFVVSKCNGLEKVSYLIIIGGGFGNVYDRVSYGSVIDFIDISYNNYHWFIFNVADIFITVGVLMLIFRELRKKKV